MKELSLQSAIHFFSTCREFAEEFRIGKGDLVLTCEYLYEPFFKGLFPEAQILFQEQFGSGEPSEPMIQAISSAIRGSYSRVIGIGGGTVMDIAKLFALEEREPLQELFTGRIPARKRCPLVLLPTTCGTGSEVTNVAIVGFPALDTKLRLASDALYADSAVLIPELMSSLPFPVFAASSIDALVHGAESYLSPLATPYSRLFSREAIRLILSGYQSLKENGRECLPSLYEDFLLAANYAGIAFGKAGCGAVHAMSYPFGGKYHVAHGESNYCLFTGVLSAYQRIGGSAILTELFDFLASLLGCSSDCVLAELDGLLSTVMEKKPLSAYGMDQEDLVPFAENVLTLQAVIMSHNPVTLTKEDVIGIYRACLDV